MLHIEKDFIQCGKFIHIPIYQSGLALKLCILFDRPNYAYYLAAIFVNLCHQLFKGK